MSDERVYGELEFTDKKQIVLAAFCDANFGILPRDVEIAKYLIQVHERYGWPAQTGFTAAKVATPRLLEIAKILHQAGMLRLMQTAVQTTDPATLDNIARSNIRLDQYDKMISFYRKEGIPTGADLLVGLPGQTAETCRRDLQFVFDRRLQAVMYATTVMPNAPMNAAEYKEKFKITVDEDGFIETTFSFDKAGYARIFELCLVYKFFVKLGIGKYLLYFMQLEHGVKALDVLALWTEKVRDAADTYPLSHRIWHDLIKREYSVGTKHWLILRWSDEEAAFLFDNIEALYRELLLFYRNEFGIEARGSDVESILSVQAAVMPNKLRERSTGTTLEHDVPGFFKALREVDNINLLPDGYRPLASYSAGQLELREPSAPARYAFADVDTLWATFELPSNLAV